MRESVVAVFSPIQAHQHFNANQPEISIKTGLVAPVGRYRKEIKYMMVGVKSDALIMDRHRISWAGRE